ncbi:hypothetical protein ES319_A08G119100v1 [Gossypium barbadense]|uniref:Uncharacterized protein n=2 Tax=Gossypium TaxID=3633 RepID=A0A5J5UQV6_GOSBA|nr:hypothetical protein ES319_A08G119100v1 [Gossypium barbadense]TYH06093.1 hypothetical protein ES288_A08G130800v1 [Gossypium darwinii]
MVVRELEPKRTSRSMALSDAPQSLPSNEKPIVVIECPRCHRFARVLCTAGKCTTLAVMKQPTKHRSYTGS